MIDPYSIVPTPPSLPFVLNSNPITQKGSLQEAYSQTAQFTAPKYRPACALVPTLSNDPRFTSLQSGQKSITNVYLALNLINNKNILPTFLHELPTFISYLHNHRFFISILENGSSDMTPGFLVLLSKVLDTLGVSYEITVRGETDKPEKSNGRRISELARVRNGAMQALYDGSAAEKMGIDNFDLVLFMNDIVWCAADLLETLYEHVNKQAHMTCATDWGGKVVYDRWVARTMTGLPFYLQKDLKEYFGDPNPGKPPYPRPLPDDPDAREKLLSLEPFQVFSCWNGAAFINPKAFFNGTVSLPTSSSLSATDLPRTNDAIRFRMAKNDGDKKVTEKASECYLICVDLWLRGLGKILLVPRASVAYDLNEYSLVRQDGGRTKPHPIGIEPSSSRIHPPPPFVWNDIPPTEVVYHDWAQWYAPETI
ncbi:hypothetical protein Clacol_010247 [Clathrus columnatus]|uniref:Glycosyltransferase family 69 protein n=1 Tax=Clathrus columnatus TaxID=1419009 RepID=A0AAV5ASI5_9AGAM|nr:hypothetical protein Clacol_010247 [Clathrus columnatus]